MTRRKLKLKRFVEGNDCSLLGREVCVWLRAHVVPLATAQVARVSSPNWLFRALSCRILSLFNYYILLIFLLCVLFTDENINNSNYFLYFVNSILYLLQLFVIYCEFYSRLLSGCFTKAYLTHLLSNFLKKSWYLTYLTHYIPLRYNNNP